MAFEFNADKAPIQPDAGDESCPAAEKRVKDEITFPRGGENTACYESDGLLRRVFPVNFFCIARRGHAPDCFHLLAAVGFAHESVVEDVFALPGLRCP